MEKSVAALQPLFRALAHPARREILTMVAGRELATGEILEAFDMSRPAVLKHLRILREGGLLTVRPSGRERMNQLQPLALKSASDWFDFFDPYWDDHLARLKQAVEEESMTAIEIVKTVLLKAPPEHVWKFLTEADRISTWFHTCAEDLTQGGDYKMFLNEFGREDEVGITGKVLEMDPPSRLVHTFTHGWLDGVETTCTWVLEATDGGTILTLTHDGWEKAEQPFGQGSAHDAGWDEHFVRLRRVLT